MPNSTGEAPIKRLMGFDVSIPKDWPEKFVRNHEPAVEMLDKTFTHVSKVQNSVKLVSPYSVGRTVWVKRVNRSTTDSPWMGPYLIEKVLGPLTLKLEHFGSVHVNRCKLVT